MPLSTGKPLKSVAVCTRFAVPGGAWQTAGAPLAGLPVELQILVALLLLLGFGLSALGLRWLLGRRERALARLLDSADALEALLKQTRERMGALQKVVGRVPEDIAAVARASLDTETQVQQGLRDVLEHRLWIARHGETASNA